jgi:hypothetical protein
MLLTASEVAADSAVPIILMNDWPPMAAEESQCEDKATSTGDSAGDRVETSRNALKRSGESNDPQDTPTRLERRAAVDVYIEKILRETGRRITRTDIWKSAGYKSRTEFERWERNDSRATKTAQRNFTRVLAGILPLK